MRAIHEELVRPIAEQQTCEAWYRGWRIVSLDGSTMDVADSEENVKAFGRPPSGCGTSAFPQLRFVSLPENGTHVLFGTHMGSYECGEMSLAEEVVRHLRAGMLCLADRLFTGGPLWKQAAATGADLLRRCKRSMKFACVQRLVEEVVVHADLGHTEHLFPDGEQLFFDLTYRAGEIAVRRDWLRHRNVNRRIGPLVRPLRFLKGRSRRPY